MRNFQQISHTPFHTPKKLHKHENFFVLNTSRMHVSSKTPSITNIMLHFIYTIKKKDINRTTALNLKIKISSHY